MRRERCRDLSSPSCEIRLMPSLHESDRIVRATGRMSERRSSPPRAPAARASPSRLPSPSPHFKPFCMPHAALSHALFSSLLSPPPIRVEPRASAPSIRPAPSMPVFLPLRSLSAADPARRPSRHQPAVSLAPRQLPAHYCLVQPRIRLVEEGGHRCGAAVTPFLESRPGGRSGGGRGTQPPTLTPDSPEKSGAKSGMRVGAETRNQLPRRTVRGRREVGAQIGLASAGTGAGVRHRRA